MRTKQSRWTADQVRDAFDSDLNMTVRRLADLSGWSVKAIKRLLMSN